MSDGIVRICNQHHLELRQIGGGLVCPGGHSCPDDWRVKEDTPYVDPRALRPTCPVHGCRLTGSGSTLDCQYGHKCTTRRPELPKTEKTMPETPIKSRRRIEHAHGTPGRYWQKCRCQPCKDAVNEHVKATKLKRLNGKGAPSPKAVVRASAPRPRALVAVVVPRTNGADLEGRVLRLRSDLAAAEQAYIAHVRKLLPGLV
jgi:hypothetical protein